MTKNEIQDLYRLTSEYSTRMLWISIKNLFRKEKLPEAHWMDDKKWWYMRYEEID